MRLASRFFRRQLEVDEVAAEAPGLPCAHGDADGHPESADNPGFGAEIPPQNQANEETQERREKIGQVLFFFTDEVANKSGKIQPHKSYKSANNHQIRSLIVARRGAGHLSQK